MGKNVKTRVEFVKYWEYEGISKKDKRTPIILSDDMQIPFCYQFKIYGEIKKELFFVTELGGVGKNVAYVDNDNFLYAGFGCNLIKYDLNTNILIKNINEYEWINNFFLLDDGFLLHQEMTVKYYDKDFNLKWVNTDCADIFANLHVKDNFEIDNNYIAIIDWYGNKHYFNKNGKFDQKITSYNSDKCKCWKQ